MPVIVFLALGFSSSARAASQELQGYVYSETSGWISLNCKNTNSCDSIGYRVLEDATGKLSGYGYSQNNEWINFNPNFGGVNINSNNELSGWAFSEKGDWVNFDNAKNISTNELQNEITSAKATINNNSLSDDGAMSLLNSLCGKFLSASECDIINNQ